MEENKLRESKLREFLLKPEIELIFWKKAYDVTCYIPFALMSDFEAIFPSPNPLYKLDLKIDRHMNVPCCIIELAELLDIMNIPDDFIDTLNIYAE